jgi:AraC-like DNA-binding protein
MFRVAITTLDTYYGIRFWPHAAEAVLGDSLVPASGFVGPAEVFLPHVAARLSAMLPNEDEGGVTQALEMAAHEVIVRARTVDEAARDAVAQIVLTHGTQPVSEIANSLGISLRQLQRRFKVSSGLTLKQFARLRRFRRAAMVLLERSPRRWVDVAYDAGYADQAHLAREFSQLIGLTAEEMRRKHRDMDHEGVDLS